MNADNPSLSADSPLKHPDEDKLGYAPFAEQLALAMLRMTPSEGLVVSINGPWGSGKTTVLNFMLYYLQQTNEKDRPIILRFNPWWFSGREDLTRLLIGQLRVRLGDRDYGELKERLADLADLVSKIPGLPGREVGEFFADKLRGQPDLIALKEKIGQLLLSQRRKILVLIDDVDRLSPSEICDLFRAIKAAANFPNIVYLIAFDTRVVTEALERELVASGQHFLEKIVQVSFELPNPDQVALRQMLFSKLETVIAKTPEELFSQMYWTNVYLEGIDHFINTPREIARLINVLRSTYPAVEGEVNPVDFIAIEALRIFRPEIYKVIRKNEELLTNSPASIWRRYGLEERKGIYESWLNLVPKEDRETVKRLLSRLFPEFAMAFNSTGYSPASLSTWRKQLRICSPDNFPTYFRFAISDDAVTSSEIKALLEKANDSKMFGQKLVDYASQLRRDGTTRVRAVLERLEDYTHEDIPIEDVPPILYALFDIGDKLLKKEDERQGMLDFGNDRRIASILNQLLLRIEEDERFQVLHKAIEAGAALSIAEYEVTSLGRQHGKLGAKEPWPESERIVNAEHLEILEQLVLRKIRSAARNGTLLATPKLKSILHCWKEYSKDEEEVKKWVSKITSSDEGLAKLLEHFGHFQLIQLGGDLAARREFRLDLKRLEPFIAPDKIIKKVRILAERENLPEGQVSAAKQFVKEYELRQQGQISDST